MRIQSLFNSSVLVLVLTICQSNTRAFAQRIGRIQLRPILVEENLPLNSRERASKQVALRYLQEEIDNAKYCLSQIGLEVTASAVDEPVGGRKKYKPEGWEVPDQYEETPTEIDDSEFLKLMETEAAASAEAEIPILMFGWIFDATARDNATLWATQPPSVAAIAINASARKEFVLAHELIHALTRGTLLRREDSYKHTYPDGNVVVDQYHSRVPSDLIAQEWLLPAPTAPLGDNCKIRNLAAVNKNHGAYKPSFIEAIFESPFLEPQPVPDWTVSVEILRTMLFPDAARLSQTNLDNLESTDEVYASLNFRAKPLSPGIAQFGGPGNKHFAFAKGFEPTDNRWEGRIGITASLLEDSPAEVAERARVQGKKSRVDTGIECSLVCSAYLKDIEPIFFRHFSSPDYQSNSAWKKAFDWLAAVPVEEKGVGQATLVLDVDLSSLAKWLEPNQSGAWRSGRREAIHVTFHIDAPIWNLTSTLKKIAAKPSYAIDGEPKCKEAAEISAEFDTQGNLEIRFQVTELQKKHRVEVPFLLILTPKASSGQPQK